MVTLKDIRSTNWQLSLQGIGQVEEGLADIRQCVDVILRTAKGTDPLRLEFGSDIYQYIDKPVNVCVPNVKKAIIEALDIWEKRVKIVSITHITTGSRIQFFVTYGLVDEEEQDTVQLFLQNNDIIVTGAPVQSLILQGQIPATYQQLKIKLVLDGVEQLPTPPAYGFTTPTALLNWVTDNWGWAGSWYLTSDKVFLFVNPGTAKLGGITITGLNLNKYVFPIPQLDPGYTFNATVFAPGGTELNSITTASISEILTWLQTYYPQYGNWEIESIYSGTGDFHQDDFTATDFLTMGQYYQFVLYTLDAPGASVEVVATLIAD